MATTMLDQNIDQSRDQDRSSQKGAHKRLSLARLGRALTLATPILLFLAAILSALVFSASMLPLAGYLSLGLALAGGVLSIMIGLLMFKS